MRALFWAVLAAVLLYSGYWVVGRWQVETRLSDALVALSDQGWEVDYASLTTRGFPSRFDTTATDLVVGTPDGRLRYETPILQVLALSYRPNRLIAAFAPSQVVTVDGQTVAVTSEDLRASLRVGLSTALPLEEVRVAGTDVGVAPAGRPGLSMGTLSLAARRAEGQAVYRLGLEATGLRPLSDDAEGGAAALGGRVALDRVHLDATATLDAPLDRRSRAAPRLLALSLADLSASVGGASLVVTGDFAPDATGALAGEGRVALRDWRALLDALERAGFVPPERRGLVEGALGGLSRGQPDIEVPVTLADGWVSALGMRLVEAPRMPQRQ